MKYAAVLLLATLAFAPLPDCPVATPKQYSWLKADVPNTICGRFAPPSGYVRQEAKGFGRWLRHLPMMPPEAKVKYFNGEEKPNRGVYVGVIDIDVGTRDLQQCADAVMRLRAEYLYAQRQYANIHFNFTNGDRADYSKWRNGQKITLSNNRLAWVNSPAANASYSSFRKYMDVIFSYAGTSSLSREMQSVPCLSVEAGDVFIVGGFPGHAVLVADVAVNTATGDKAFLLLQSYMPAQSIQVLANPSNQQTSPWYSLKEICQLGKLHTPEWTFSASNAKRFKAE